MTLPGSKTEAKDNEDAGDQMLSPKAPGKDTKDAAKSAKENIQADTGKLVKPKEKVEDNL